MSRTRSRGGILCPNSSVGLWAGDGVQVKWEPKRRRSQDGRQAAKMRAPIKQDQTASLGPRDLLFLRAQSWTGRPLSGARSDVGTDEEKMPGGPHGTDPTTYPLGKITEPHTAHQDLKQAFTPKPIYLSLFPPKLRHPSIAPSSELPPHAPEPPRPHPHVNIPPISRLGMSHPGPEPLSAPP